MPGWVRRELFRDGKKEQGGVVLEDSQTGIKLELTRRDLEFLLALGNWDPFTDDGVQIGKLHREPCAGPLS